MATAGKLRSSLHRNASLEFEVLLAVALMVARRWPYAAVALLHLRLYIGVAGPSLSSPSGGRTWSGVRP